ncbi:hypothetical protein BURKHO8Y_60077 [Burkholderia sp. 8Y]|nr:hypothetical protein BURKHO8Y_60077 [Burkholderia sp. 8Y]
MLRNCISAWFISVLLGYGYERLGAGDARRRFNYIATSVPLALRAAIALRAMRFARTVYRERRQRLFLFVTGVSRCSTLSVLAASLNDVEANALTRHQALLAFAGHRPK